MKVRIMAEMLRECCDDALCKRDSNLPILLHAHLKVSAEGLVFTTTDMEKTRSDTCTAVVDEEGECTVEVAKLKSCLSGITDWVEMTLGGTEAAPYVAMKLPGRRAYRLESFPPAEFPLWPESQMEPIEKLQADAFLGAVMKAGYCINPEEARDFLRGFALAGGWACASDGGAGALIALESGLPEEGVILPRASLVALVAVCQEPPRAEVKFYLSRNQHGTVNGFRIAARDMVVTTKVIDTRFPLDSFLNHTNALKDYPVKLTVKVPELLAALERLRPFCTTGKYETLVFAYKDKSLLLSNRSEDATDQVSAEVEGVAKDQDIQGALNPAFLRRVAALGKDGTLTLLYKSADSFYGVLLEGSEAQHFIMGVRL